MPGAAHFLDVEKYYTVTQSVIDKISDIMYSTIITDNNILEIGMGDSSIQLKIVISNGTVSQFTKNYIPMEFRMSDHGRIKTIFITAYKYIFPLWIFRNIEIDSSILISAAVKFRFPVRSFLSMEAISK